MIPNAVIALRHLAKMGNYKLANKIYDAIKTGKTVHLTAKDRKAWNVVRHDVTKNLREEFRTPFPKTNILRREFYDMGRGGPHKQGSLRRAYYQRSRSTPMVDIDFEDVISHNPSQVIWTGKTAKSDAIQKVRDFLKTKAGKKHAYKIYQTGAGLRLIDVSKHGRGMSIKKYKKIMDELGGDPSYRESALRKRKDYGLTLYDARLSPKPGRPLKGDLTPIGNIRGSAADLSRTSVDETHLMHDNLINTILQTHDRKGIVRLPGILGKVDFSKMEF
jgi:hypothetical protein